MSASPSSLVAALVLAAVHWLVPPLRPHRERSRDSLSAAAGISVAYVFVGLLPDLGHLQRAWLEAYPDRPLFWLEEQMYLAALIGLLATYGLEMAAGAPEEKPGRRFALDVSSFAVYNGVIGYFVAGLRGGIAPLLAVLAFSSHFLVNDAALRRHSARLYDRIGRPALSLAVLIGWALGAAWTAPVRLLGVLVGLLAGGIILNVLKEELPREREGRFLAFVIGALAYASLYLALNSTLE